MSEKVAAAYDHYINGIECGVDSDDVNERYEAYVDLVNKENSLD